jgi:DNA-binding IscR family transcriptional regulator
VRPDDCIHVVECDSRPGQRLWRICSGGTCLVHRNINTLTTAYRALLLSQGRLVGDE